MKKPHIAFFLGLVLAVGVYLYFVVPGDRPSGSGPTVPGQQGKIPEAPQWTIVPAPEEPVDTPGSVESNEKVSWLTLSGRVTAEGRTPTVDSVPLTVTVITVETPLPQSVRDWLGNVEEYQSVADVLEAAREKGFDPAEIRSHVGRRITRSITTNAAGEFELSRAPPGLYRIHRENQKTVGTGSILQLPGNVRPMTLTLRETGDFEGRVVGPDGSPLAGVRVSFTNDERPARRTTRSGTFVIRDVPLRRPLNFFAFEKPGYAIREADRGPLRTVKNDTVFQLQRGTYLRVSTRKPGGEGLQEGAVVAHPAEGFEQPPDPRVRHLRGDTYVEFFGLPAGTWSLRLAHGPYSSASRRVQLARNDSSVLTLPVRETRAVFVEVRNLNTDSPVRNVRIVGQGYNQRGEPVDAAIRQEGVVGPGLHKLRLDTSLSEVHLSVHPRRDPFLRPRSVRRTLEDDTISVRLPQFAREDGSISRRFEWVGPDGTKRGVSPGRAEVYHRTSGRRLLQFPIRALGNGEHQFPAGDLFLMGYTRTEDGDRVFSTGFGSTSSGHSTVRLELEKPARVKGTIESDPTDRLHQVGLVAFNPMEHSDGSDPRLPFEVPGWLVQRIGEDGTFSFSKVPPGEVFYLVGTRSKDRLGPGVLLHRVQSLGPLSSGETRTVRWDVSF